MRLDPPLHRHLTSSKGCALSEQQQVETFFKLLFGPSIKGYICLATLTPGKAYKEEFFEWPKHLPNMLAFVDRFRPTHNVYFCPQLLKDKSRTKESVKLCTSAWSDLDKCKPSMALVKPSIAIESSPYKYQAYWIFETPQDPETAEDISKRIAYYHAFQGADKSGWDLTQLLRVPFTFNMKYDEEVPVTILEANRNKYRPDDFDKYPPIVKNHALDTPMPEVVPDTSGAQILKKYENNIQPQVDFLFSAQPDEDWSKNLWFLQLSCFEAGMNKEEVFAVARDAACNKYKRDGKEEEKLWEEVVRAEYKYKEQIILAQPAIEQTTALLTPEERELAAGRLTFVSNYISWAKSLGDAAPQYHQAGAFIILGALLAGSVRLPTSFGTMKPNLWFMILADTTLTRKTTAMDIAMDLLEEVNSEVILATDGSIEGLMGSLAIRPGKPSIFLRDEFSGLLESLTKKDYYAGMAETLTKLYDGKLQKRVLKKEIIEVRDPVLLFFAGGIRNKVTMLLTSEHISSGFLPRFVFITAESDVSQMRPLGPPTVKDTSGRSNILRQMADIRAHYHTEQTLTQVDGKLVIGAPNFWNAELSPEVWLRYNQLETDMMRSALASENPEALTPTYDRLCKSALKAAMLLAAAEKRPPEGEPVQVEMIDLLQAIVFMEQWCIYGNQVISSIGITQDERFFQKALMHVVTFPGITRGRLMQNFRLTARNAEVLLATLEQRGQIIRRREGKGERIYPLIFKPGETKVP